MRSDARSVLLLVAGICVATALAPVGTARADGAPSAPAAPATKASSPAVDAAVARLSEGKFDEALEAARSVPEDDPAHARARYLVGEISLMIGDAPAGESAFREALEKKPGSAAILGGLGHALLLEGRAEEAVEPLEKAVAADPKAARARAWLGLARSRAGKADAGRKDLAAAAKADPQDPEIARAAVEERIDAKDVPGAGKAAAAFAAARKDHPMGPFLVAFVADRAGKFEDAIAGYEKAIALDAGFLDAHKDLAILCIAQNPLYTDAKRTKKAMEHFAVYEEKGGRDATVLQVYAQLKSFLAANGGAPSAPKDDGKAPPAAK